MAILFKVAGLFMAIGGMTATGLGWPYRMIDWGNIQVLLGGMFFVGGLLLAAAGVVLGRVAALQNDVAALSTYRMPDDTGPQMMASVTDVGPVAQHDLPTRGEGGMGGAGLAAASVAGAVAVGAAVLSTSRSTSDQTAAGEPARDPDAHDRRDGAWEGEAGAPSSIGTLPIAQDSATHEPQLVSGTHEDHKSTSLADDGLMWIKPEEKPGLSLDALTARINEAAGDLTALRRGVVDVPADPVVAVPTFAAPVGQVEAADLALQADDPAVPIPDEDLAPDVLQPNAHDIGTPADADITPDRKPAEDLTLASDMADSHGQMEPTAPEVRDEAAVEELGDPAGPARHPAAADDIRDDAVDLANLSPAPLNEAHPTDEADPIDANGTDGALSAPVAGPDTEEADATSEPASQPPQPAANAEGVVSVHKVADSTFTMFVDGTIRAETPDGAFGFATVSELKAYLAGDKSVARPLD